MPPKTKGKGRKTGAQKKKKNSSPGESPWVKVVHLRAHVHSPHKSPQRASSPLGNKMDWVCFGFLFCPFGTGSLWNPGSPQTYPPSSVFLVLGLQALPPHLTKVKLSCPPLRSLESRFHQAGVLENASLPNSPWSPI